MYKKMLTLSIVLMLLLSFTSALAAPERYRMAEDFQRFDIEVEIPEGALYKQNPQEGWLCLEIWYEEPSDLYFDFHVSYSEEVDNKFLSDFTQEETDLLLERMHEGFSIPSYEFFDTPSGTMILFSRETDPQAGDYATMTTVYQGFFVSLYGCHKDYTPLTDGDLALMHQIVESIWITDTGK